MQTRRWAWLRTLIVGLITRPPVGWYRVDDPDGKTYRLRPIHASRLSELFFAEK